MVSYRNREKAAATKKERSRIKILGATRELLEEFGDRPFTINLIAERAGVNRNTINEHFPDKQLLKKEAAETNDS